MKINIKWLGHSCFKIQYGEYSIVIDPYKDKKVPGLENIREEANMVLCSHDHDDHNFKQAVNISGGINPFCIKEIKCFHDNKQGQLRGENLIHILTVDGIRIAHLGDIGEDITDKLIDDIGEIDVALIPVGGFYTIDGKTAKNLAEQLDVKVIIPMHYKTEEFGFKEIQHLDCFLKLFDNVKTYNSNNIDIDKNTAAQVAVLKYERD